MNVFGPNAYLWIWQIINLALLGLGIVALIKFVIVLFKADRAIDEIRDYIRRRS